MKFFKRIFFWLSGAGTESLETCPNWEQRKYVAFGATVLVPTVFAFIACSYALSTITDNWRIIFGVSLAWGFIIMTVDRALLSTYRSYQKWHKKLGQFALRFVVAMLMGLTISHPLTLLLFKDTIQSVVEEKRDTEIEELRNGFAVRKTEADRRIASVEADIAGHRQGWDDSFKAEFLVTEVDKTGAKLHNGEAQTELEKAVEEATAPHRAKIAGIGDRMTGMTAGYTKVQQELDHWQTEFEREVNGQRSGIAGLGPRARSIRDDQLAWRREEAKRLAGVLEHLTTEKAQMESLISGTVTNLNQQFETAAAEEAESLRKEAERIAGLKRKMQEEQAGQFVEQQNALRATISQQIDTRLKDLEQLQKESSAIATDEQDRIVAIRAEPRKDILTQTLALHKLFLAGNEGGQFALTAYLILALLFLLVDTIPIVLKFFSKPGPYDTLVDCDEVRYDKERETFLASYDEYMAKLTSGGLLNLTQNRPLEKALIDGVDRSRVAKEFLESLMELEGSFQQRIASEKASIKGERSTRAAILEQMADTFYEDLHQRM